MVRPPKRLDERVEELVAFIFGGRAAPGAVEG